MKIELYAHYIDRRLGIDVDKPHGFYRGYSWIERGYDTEFMREVVINEYGYFVELSHEQKN